MSYQAEERYWTDYVRVATPVVGLLLLLGVFWYWASSLIGDQSNTPPESPPASLTVIPADTPTPNPTPDVVLTPETAVPATETEGPEEPSPTEGGSIDETPTETPEEPTTDCEFDYQEGEVVLSRDDDVNFRAEPSTSAEIIDVLPLDRELTVVDCQPVEGDGIVWWHVSDNETGLDGYVAEEWLKPQE